MIYTEDSISENTREIITNSNEEYVERENIRHRRFNILILSLIFIMIITCCIMEIFSKSSQHIWIWPMVLFAVFLNGNQQHSARMDVAKICINPKIIDDLRNYKKGS